MTRACCRRSSSTARWRLRPPARGPNHGHAPAGRGLPDAGAARGHGMRGPCSALKLRPGACTRWRSRSTKVAPDNPRPVEEDDVRRLLEAAFAGRVPEPMIEETL